MQQAQRRQQGSGGGGAAASNPLQALLSMMPIILIVMLALWSGTSDPVRPSALQGGPSSLQGGPSPQHPRPLSRSEAALRLRAFPVEMCSRGHCKGSAPTACGSECTAPTLGWHSGVLAWGPRSGDPTAGRG